MPLDLEELERLLGGATPGPWKTWGMQAMADPKNTSNVDDCAPVAMTYQEDAAGHPRTFDLDLICALRNAAPELLALARRGQASASGWKAGAEAERERIAASFERSAQMLFEEGNEIGSAEHRGFAFAIRHMPLPKEPQSQAPASPSADELAEALEAVLELRIDAPVGGYEAVKRARALLARRRAP